MNVGGDSCWLLFIASLPGQTGTPRIRLWRSLKGLGAAVVRDGVHLLPAREPLRKALEKQAQEVLDLGGTAYLLDVKTRSDVEEQAFRALFDRSEDYTELAKDVARFRSKLTQWSEPQARRALKSLRRDFNNVGANDYFPGAAMDKTRQALQEAEMMILQCFAPNEPRSAQREIERLDKADYQARVWATRRRLWVDRLASAWLIRSFIDPGARFVWLANPADCPSDALGFDFDGAAFTHVGDRVTFEVLLTSFALESDPALVRVADLVHHLDVGGRPIPEAAGFETILTGARERCTDDDCLLTEMTPVLDCLYTAFAPAPA
ncbi:MAG: chromate resistance protein [Gammaproteobacteria bacterium]|nr:chromate resistance protein [Gammaproteobacteria bacterium]MBA3731745.1 chromate resistance protein [Gammaproteobacteria bacterium]